MGFLWSEKAPVKLYTPLLRRFDFFRYSVNGSVFIAVICTETYNMFDLQLDYNHIIKRFIELSIKNIPPKIASIFLNAIGI